MVVEQRPAEGGGEAELVELDFAPPFKRVSMLSELERLLGAPGLSDVVLAAQRAEQRAVAAGELEPRRPGERPGEQHEDANAAEAVRAAEALLSSCCDRAHVSCPAPRTVPRLLDRLTSELIERPGELILFTVTFCANAANDLTCPPHILTFKNHFVRIARSCRRDHGVLWGNGAAPRIAPRRRRCEPADVGCLGGGGRRRNGSAQRCKVAPP